MSRGSTPRQLNRPIVALSSHNFSVIISFDSKFVEPHIFNDWTKTKLQGVTKLLDGLIGGKNTVYRGVRPRKYKRFIIIISDCGCDHECIPDDGESFVCACKSGYNLLDDGKTCRKYKITLHPVCVGVRERERERERVVVVVVVVVNHVFTPLFGTNGLLSNIVIR